MQYCTECKIHIEDNSKICPLCHKLVENELPEVRIQDYPEFEARKRKDKKMINFFSKTAVILIIGSFIVNMLVWNGNLWSAITSAIILYIWLMGLLTFKKGVHLGLKLMTHAISISVLLVIINLFAYNERTISRLSWAVSYAVPIVFIVFIIAINIFMWKHRQNRRDFILYQISLCVIGFIPLIFVLIGVTEPMAPSIVAAVFSYLTIFGLFLFARKIVISELGRKFHT